MKMYICGCVRNTASYIDAVFLNIEKICSELDDYHIIISYTSNGFSPSHAVAASARAETSNSPKRLQR